ncbi:hypothetical protein JB92DRAFT_2977032 [Gautieria morchelliformis]|nr:hypothetical protein JB92DRAFT_2977032 [Gautieria morchelliformis]
MTSITRPTLQRTAAGLLLLAALPIAKADCFIDDRTGERVCNGLSAAARAGIGLGILAVITVILVALALARRRRIQRANQAYITNANTYPAPGYNYNQASYNPTNMPHQPQYPPQSHTPYDQYNGAPYNAQPYSHPGSPPQYPSYAPPLGPPPMQKE